MSKGQFEFLDKNLELLEKILDKLADIIAQ